MMLAVDLVLEKLISCLREYSLVICCGLENSRIHILDALRVVTIGKPLHRMESQMNWNFCQRRDQYCSSNRFLSERLNFSSRILIFYLFSKLHRIFIRSIVGFVIYRYREYIFTRKNYASKVISGVVRRNFQENNVIVYTIFTTRLSQICTTVALVS